MEAVWVRTGKESVKFLPLGDPHVQARDSWTVRKLNKYLAYALEHKCYVVDLGDSLDFPTRDSKTSPLVGEQLSNHEALEYLCTLYLPLVKAGLFLGIVEGNHTGRAWDRVGLLPGQIIAAKLNVPYLGFRAVINLQLGTKHHKPGQGYNTFIQVGHGAAGGGSLGNAVNRTQKESVEVLEGVDIVVEGHRHRSFCYPTTILKPHPQKQFVVARERWLCGVPGFHPTSERRAFRGVVNRQDVEMAMDTGYAEAKQLAPTSHAHWLFTIELRHRKHGMQREIRAESLKL